MHLAWHFQLENEAVPPDYFTHWIQPCFPAQRLRQAAAYFRRVWTANGHNRIPYGFSPPNDSLDVGSGAFLIGPPRFGLTCASFVLAAFHGARLPLVEYDTWPVERDGDHTWQLQIVEMLERHGASAEHIENIRSQIGLVRFRPEDVAAGAALVPPPADFAAASALGESILERLKSRK